MQVAAIASPRHSGWRWRITDYSGGTLEESETNFSSIAAAVAAGRERLLSMDLIDRSDSAPKAWPARFGRR